MMPAGHDQPLVVVLLAPRNRLYVSAGAVFRFPRWLSNLCMIYIDLALTPSSTSCTGHHGSRRRAEIPSEQDGPCSYFLFQSVKASLQWELICRPYSQDVHR